MIVAVALMFNVLVSTKASAQFFDVNYFGGGVASLAPGSDNPVGATLVAGDSFFWRISAQNSAFWSVVNSGSFFPFMAFGVAESGIRTGNYQLTLYRNGIAVFAESVDGSEQSEVHLGTNDVGLFAGLEFDQMELGYVLTSATSTQSGLPIGTTLQGMLPIFGAPEENPFDRGITYVTSINTTVPEPSTLLLVGVGMFTFALASRRRVRESTKNWDKVE